MRTGPPLIVLLRRHWRLLPMLLIPLLLSPLLVQSSSSSSASSTASPERRCAYLLLMVSSYWVLELLPLSLTAMLPFLLAPLLRIGTTGELAMTYFTDIHFLAVGGVVLSVAMEDTGLSRRLALRIVSLLGTRPRWLLLGFMLPSWLLSMWMSNTGTTILMFPFVMAAITEAEQAAGQLDALDDSAGAGAGAAEQGIELQCGHQLTKIACGTAAASKEPDQPQSREATATNTTTISNNHAICYLLSVAYACNVGGVATLIGTSANLLLVGQLQQIYRVSNAITFANWMAFSFPLSLLSLLLIWLLLQVIFIGPRETFTPGSGGRQQHQLREAQVKRYFRHQLEALGPMRFAEWATLAAFPCVLLLLLTGKLTSQFGWHYLFGKLHGKPVVSDATAMMMVALLLLLVPNLGTEAPGLDKSPQPGTINSLGYRPVVRWDRVVRTIPLDILLLIGGGLALAKLTKDTRLSETIGSALMPALQSLPTELTLMLLCSCVLWLTEITSNMATASVLLPIVAQVANCLGKNPLLFMVPLTITCSYAFCLPTATPPNAIVFSSGRVGIPQMAKAGVVLNLVFSLVVPIYTMLLGRLVYGMHLVPEWAVAAVATCGGGGGFNGTALGN